jgi:hypothetical protein
MLPIVFIHAMQVSNHYGVSTDIAIIQMCGGFDELPGYGQPLENQHG